MINVPNTPIIAHITLVLVLLGSSTIMITSIMEKIYRVEKPTQAQAIASGIDPFIVFNVIMFGFDDAYVIVSPRALNKLAMNEVYWGMKGSNNDPTKLDT